MGKTKSLRSNPALRSDGMLPTPAKTPKKRHSEATAGISAVARNLFPTRNNNLEEVMPSPRRKGRKKYTGFTLDSFAADDEEPSIRIYTDSQDRVPEVDASAENPFYNGESSVPAEPRKSRGRPRKGMAPREDEMFVQGTEQHEDGLVYVL